MSKKMIIPVELYIRDLYRVYVECDENTTNDQAAALARQMALCGDVDHTMLAADQEIEYDDVQIAFVDDEAAWTEEEEQEMKGDSDMQITLNIEDRDGSIALIRALSREAQGLHDAAIRGLAEDGAEDVQTVKAYYKYLYEQSKFLAQIASDAVQQLTKSCDYDDVRMLGLYSGAIDWKLEFRQGVEK